MPLVWLFVGITFIVAYPIAKVLDWALGGEMSAVYTKNELKSLIRINVEDPQRVKESGLTPEDGKLLTGALSFKEELVEGAMTPLDAVFSYRKKRYWTRTRWVGSSRAGTRASPSRRKARPWPFYMRRIWSASASSGIRL